jgi:hypothetical protein
LEQAAAISRIQAFTRSHPRSVLFDDAGSTLLDVYSGRTLALDLSRITSTREEANKETGGRYLVLTRDDGIEIALADPGIAFAPDLRNSGPLPTQPKAVCLRDFAEALARVRHYLFDHPEAAVSRETLGHVQLGIAILDGARRVGFDVGGEERQLEECLAEIERRGT